MLKSIWKSVAHQLASNFFINSNNAWECIIIIIIVVVIVIVIVIINVVVVIFYIFYLR